MLVYIIRYIFYIIENFSKKANMTTFSNLNTKALAVQYTLRVPVAAFAAPCCLVDINNPPPATGCSQPKREILDAKVENIEIAPSGTPLLDGSGTAGDSKVTLIMDSGIMTDNISVNLNGSDITWLETNNNAAGLTATVPLDTTSIVAYIQECYLQTGGWVPAPDRQGTEYSGSATFDLWVISNETDIDLGD